ncbi:MAG: hypothetical protein K2X00_23810 [Nitrospiraceae bacterium]|nr:hypothetical protein [Nitrospiraceae bacterium]OQW66821.1 MAG: hypothetical protein BVN29_04015 [Nitrospira sp. ST-bin5]
MPNENNFQHDELSRKSPGERLTTAELTGGALPESPAWFEGMADCGTRLASAGVRAIVLLHGSIHGSDVFGMQRLDDVGGLKRGYSRGVSGVDALLAAMREGGNGIPALSGGLKPPLLNDDAIRKIVDDQVGEAGNFTSAYTTLFQQAINKRLPQPIACRRILWTSEHHHLGRAAAAVRLLHELHILCETQKLGKEDRILVQAHGQAGLVLALASNLLCPSPITKRPKLLGLLVTFAEQHNYADLAATARHIEPLLADHSLLNGATLDVVTLGTPVRYGWDLSGMGRLLHIVNHRNLRTDGKTWLSKMELPQVTMEMPIAWGGDYVQQLAVAGSDAVPATEAAKAVNKAVWEMVEPYDGFERWLECARRAVRFPSEGNCLLVDYKDCTNSTNVHEHYYGHAAYTRLNAMYFNTSEIIRSLYQDTER